MRLNRIILILLIIISVITYSCKKDNTSGSASSLKWNNYPTVAGLSNYHVNCIAMDSYGNLWFGTGTGILKDSVNINRWSLYSMPDTVNTDNNNILSIAFDQQGIGWFGTAGSGVLYYYEKNKTRDTSFYTYLDTLTHRDTTIITGIFDTIPWRDFTNANKGLINDTVWKIAVDGTGDIWFSTSGGITELKFNDTTKWYRYTKGLTSDSVWSIAIVQNSLYLGTLGKGILKLSGSSSSYSFTPNIIPKNYSIIGNYIFASAVDSLKNIWFGTPSGVMEYNVGLTQWQQYTTSNGLVSNSVFSVAIDNHGNKWFGTDNGVSKFDGKNWTTYTTSNGLLGNSVSAIFADKQDNIWFGTQSGISELVNK